MMRKPWHALQSYPWQTVLAWTLVGLAVSMQLAHVAVVRQAQGIQAAQPERAADTQETEPTQPQQPWGVLPSSDAFTKDLSHIFKVAQAQGMVLGAIEYRMEDNAQLPQVELRSMEFRVNEDYPRTKAFIARILQTMPHVSLQEIRVERRDPLSAQGSIQIRLVLLYQSSVLGNVR